MKDVFLYIFVYIFGNILFDFIISIVQLIFYRFQGAILDIYKLFIQNIYISIISTTILFITTLLIRFTYNKYLIKKLNSAIKERSDKNEE